MDDLKKIDIHLHVAYDGQNLEFQGMKIADGAAMKEYMDSHGIEHGVLMSGSENYTTEGLGFGSNIDNIALAKKYPDTFSFMCYVDVHKPDNLKERLIHYKELGAVGVGEYSENYWLDSPKFEPLFEACSELDLPILFHISPEQGFNYGVADHGGLPLLEMILKKYPNLKVIGHSQPFWYEIGGDMLYDIESRNNYPEGTIKDGGRLTELFRKYNNLYADLSANSAGNAIMRDPDFGYKFLEEFQDRLIFATDMVSTEMYFPLGDWLEHAVNRNNISIDAYYKICRHNAVNLLKLPIKEEASIF